MVTKKFSSLKQLWNRIRRQNDQIDLCAKQCVKHYVKTMVK